MIYIKLLGSATTEVRRLSPPAYNELVELSANYWVVACREPEGTPTAPKLIRVSHAYTGASNEVRGHHLPAHFSVNCEHCKQRHDYYGNEPQFVSLPRVLSNAMPKVTTEP